MGVDGLAVDVGEHPAGVSIPTAPRPGLEHLFSRASTATVVGPRSMARLRRGSCRGPWLVADGDEYWPTEIVAASRSTSSHRNPSSSLRRILVLARSHKAGNQPVAPQPYGETTAVRGLSRPAVPRWGSTAAWGRGPPGRYFLVTIPRRTASLSAPRMMRWISSTVFGASGRFPFSGCSLVQPLHDQVGVDGSGYSQATRSTWRSILRRYPSQVLAANSTFLPGSHRAVDRHQT